MHRLSQLARHPLFCVCTALSILCCDSTELPNGPIDAGADTGTSLPDAGQRDQDSPISDGCTEPRTPQPPTDPGSVAPARDPARAGEQHQFFKISVLDAATRSPIAGARLETTNHIVFTSDRSGVVAFYEPGLIDTDVYFSATHPGYEIAADQFGN